MSLSIVILAAGKGTRMKSAKTKVMHKLAGKALVEYVIDTAKELEPESLIVVYGNGADQMQRFLIKKNVVSILQSEQRGTGHAVMQAEDEFSNAEQVLILYGDVPLIKKKTLISLIKCGNKDSLRVLTTKLIDPTGYGRIIRDEVNNIVNIIEHEDADQATLIIKEVNSGIMVLPVKLLMSVLSKLKNNNGQGEYYLTDVVSIAFDNSININTLCCENTFEVFGVNTRQQLAKLERYYQLQQANNLMSKGATLFDPARLDIRGEVTLGNDVTIDVNVILEGKVNIADNVKIGANCIIKDSSISHGTEVLANSMIDNAMIGANVIIGPFARLRPGTILSAQAKVGNFVEIKNSCIGEGSKVNHLSYVGDTSMGHTVNIGAGTITCNYDGSNKHSTIIGDNVFVGSNSQLVAPVSIGNGATIGAGTTLRKDAVEGALTVNKINHKTIVGWKKKS